MSDDPQSASWAIEPHTEAKLAILGAYLRAWFPILGLGGFSRIIYIDGFAGPGRYRGGQDGSPIVALKALASQPIPLNSDFEFHFVERDARIASALKANIDRLRDDGLIGPKAHVYVHDRQTFVEAYSSVIGPALQKNANSPVFAFVDPFGWTGIPLAVLSEFLKRRSAEVFVNFMFEEINRFLEHPDQRNNFDSLFGSSDWNKGRNYNRQERRAFLHDLYSRQLSQLGGARYVRSFEMRNRRGRVDYFLFFATNSRKGLIKMKEAMWKIDPTGDFIFSDATDPNQTVLFEAEPNWTKLRQFIVSRFSGATVTRQEIEFFVVDRTPFLPTHYRRVLRDLETSGGLKVLDPKPGRRIGQYPDPMMRLVFA